VPFIIVIVMHHHMIMIVTMTMIAHIGMRTAPVAVPVTTIAHHRIVIVHAIRMILIENAAAVKLYHW
jgi:hypothetical protein